MDYEIAMVGAGCFWGVEHLFKKCRGVVSTTVGYSGGSAEAPTYQQVCSGESGHAEVVRIEFDDKEVSYLQLLDYFWRTHDPTEVNRQGVDIGTQYRSIIFYYSDQQRDWALWSKKQRQSRYEQAIATEIVAASPFYAAEDDHQDYFGRNSAPICHVLQPE